MKFFEILLSSFKTDTTMLNLLIFISCMFTIEYYQLRKYSFFIPSDELARAV